LVGLVGLPAIASAAWLGGASESSALWRMMSGTAISLLTIAAAVALAVPIGLALGALAGGGSPLADALLARLSELSSALPPLLIVGLLLAAKLMPAAAAIALVMGVARGIELGRLVRGEMLRVSAEDFVTAARALGLNSRQLWLRHVLPHATGPVLVSGALTAAATVALDAALGLFGLGNPASWGGQIAAGLTRGNVGDVLWPSLAAVVTTGALYSLAEALTERSHARRRHAP
jgi:ABC-type dipeptide/oligopeptide/nickel transport system permease subunit